MHQLKTSVKSVYISIAAFLTINNLIYNTLPIILGGLATQRGFNEAQIGVLGSTFLAGQMLTNITGPLWVGRVNWKITVSFAMLIFAIAMLLSAHVNFSLIAICYLIAGGTTGISLACMFCLISNMDNPVRAYSMAIIAQCVIAGILVIVFQSFLLPKYGLEGLSYLIATLILISIPFVRWVPMNLKAQLEDSNKSKIKENLKFKISFSFWAFIGLIGIIIYYTGQTGIWAFVERIGNSRGFDPDFIGIVAAGSLILSGLGAWAADLTGNKLGNFKPLVIGILIFIIAMVILSATNDKYLYFIAIIIYSAAWNYMTPFQLLAVKSADKSGTYASMIPAFQSIGAAVGPVSVGLLIVDGGSYINAYLIAIALALLCMVFFWCAHINRAPKGT